MSYQYQHEKTFKIKNKYLTKVNRKIDINYNGNIIYIISKEILRLEVLSKLGYQGYSYCNNDYLKQCNDDNNLIDNLKAQQLMYEEIRSINNKTYYDDGLDDDDAFDLIE